MAGDKALVVLIALVLIALVAAKSDLLVRRLHANLAFRSLGRVAVDLDLPDAMRSVQLANALRHFELSRPLLSERQSTYLDWVEKIRGLRDDAALSRELVVFASEGETGVPLSVAFIRRWRYYEQSGEHSQAEVLAEELQKLSPELPLRLAAGSRWSLLGVDWGEERFVLESPVVTALYWQQEPGSPQFNWEPADGEGRLLQFGDRIYELVEGGNLVANPGFERPVSWQVGVPPGFTQAHTSQLIEPYTIERMERNGRESTVACVTNTSNRLRGGLTSASVPTQPGQVYLVGGWMRTLGSSGGRLALADWHGQGPTLLPLSENRAVGDWQLVYGLVQPTSEMIQVWADNFESTGKVCFDNLFILPLTLPQSATTGG